VRQLLRSVFGIGEKLAMSREDEILPQGRLRVMQIIAGALFLGVVTFLAIVLIIVSGQPNGAGIAPAGSVPIISIVAVLLLIVQVPLAFHVPAFLTRSALRRIAAGTWQLPPGANAASFQTDTSKLLAVRQTSMIIGLALLEGVSFFGCIAYLMEAQPFALGVVVLAVMLMLVNSPTEGRVRAWLERQADQLAELREQRDVAAE
jgi:hypothetical protein